MRGFRPNTDGSSDGRFVGGIITGILLAIGVPAMYRLGQWLFTTDLWTWATATRTVEYSIVGLVTSVLPLVFIGLIAFSIIGLLQMFGGSGVAP